MIKKYKKDYNYSYTLGTFVTIELLKNRPKEVIEVYIHSKQEKNEAYNLILNLCKENGINVIENNDKVFTVLSEKENCLVIGVFKKFESSLEMGKNHVVLDCPSNMGNMGTIIRSSLGFGINNIVIIRPAVDIFDPKVIRSSMGAIFSINFCYFNSINDYINRFKQNSLYLFMLNGIENLSKVTPKQPFSLVFGNEARGLPNEYASLGTTVNIRHNNRIDSLNLDNAVSIGLYEFTKHNFD